MYRPRCVKGLLVPFALLSFNFIGCAAPPTLEEGSSALARSIHDQVGLRTDPSNLRLLIHEPRAMSRDPEDEEAHGYWINRAGFCVQVSREIEQELVHAFSPVFHVVEGRVDLEIRPRHPDPADPDCGHFSTEERSRICRLGANAVLLGDFAVIDRNKVRTSLRVVDAETGIILATSRLEMLLW